MQFDSHILNLSVIVNIQQYSLLSRYFPINPTIQYSSTPIYATKTKRQCLKSPTDSAIEPIKILDWRKERGERGRERGVRRERGEERGVRGEKGEERRERREVRGEKREKGRGQSRWFTHGLSIVSIK
ncbi:MAG: hypothetical protein HQK83_13045 [Fibrobacteria bacterium]|nr:hypothetical protein [Fibrobacteria bacterium]